ncbi:nucleotide exchange factor GrpE, partial [archaeon]
MITAALRSLNRGPKFRPILKLATARFSDGSNGTSQQKSEQSPAEAQAASEEAGKSGSKEDPTVALQSEIKSLKDQVLRSYAEGENIRRIAARDVENARSYAISSFAKATLDIADDIDRALSAVPEDKRNTDDPVLKQLVMGLE